MQEWWSYRPGDFLLFSPRTYWRLFQLANETLWPLQIPVLLIGAAILTTLFRPRAWADRVIPAVLAAAWLCVSIGFLWMHYAAINWTAIYFVPVFVGRGATCALVRGRLAFAAERGVGGMIGMALYVYALALHPLIALVAGDLFRLQKLLASRQIRPPSRRSVSYRSRPAALGLYRS